MKIDEIYIFIIIVLICIINTIGFYPNDTNSFNKNLYTGNRLFRFTEYWYPPLYMYTVIFLYMISLFGVYYFYKQIQFSIIELDYIARSNSMEYVFKNIDVLNYMCCFGVSIAAVGHFTYILFFGYRRIELWEQLLLIVFYATGIIGCNCWTILNFILALETLAAVTFFLVYNDMADTPSHRTWAVFRNGKRNFVYISVLTSLVFLFGISILSSHLGTVPEHLSFMTTYSHIMTLSWQRARGVYLGLILILFNFCFKMGMWPLHFWVKTMYPVISKRLLYFLLVPSKIVYFAVILPKIFLFVECWFLLSYFVALLGLSSAVYGAVVALKSKNEFMEMLAGSSIGQAGLILFLVGIGNKVIVLFYIPFIYTAYTAMIYSLCCYLPIQNRYYYSLPRQEQVETFQNDIATLEADRLPLTLHFFIYLTTFSGLPPFMIFIGKILINLELLSSSFILAFVFIFFVNIATVLYILRFLIVFYKPDYVIFWETHRTVYDNHITPIQGGILIFISFLLVYLSLKLTSIALNFGLLPI